MITFDETRTILHAVVFFLSSIEEPLTTAAPLGIMLKEYYGVHFTLTINGDNGLTAVRKELILLLPKVSRYQNIEINSKCEL